MSDNQVLNGITIPELSPEQKLALMQSWVDSGDVSKQQAKSIVKAQPRAVVFATLRAEINKVISSLVDKADMSPSHPESPGAWEAMVFEVLIDNYEGKPKVTLVRPQNRDYSAQNLSKKTASNIASVYPGKDTIPSQFMDIKTKKLYASRGEWYHKIIKQRVVDPLYYRDTQSSLVQVTLDDNGNVSHYLSKGELKPIAELAQVKSQVKS